MKNTSKTILPNVAKKWKVFFIFAFIAALIAWLCISEKYQANNPYTGFAHSGGKLYYFNKGKAFELI